MEHKIKKERLEKGLYWNHAWSIVEGCVPVSTGCGNCWSAQNTYIKSHQKNQKIKDRYQGLTTEYSPDWTGAVRLMKSELEKPFRIVKPSVFLVLNDLFCEEVPFSFIHEAFQVMAACYHHDFIILTKRPERMKEFLMQLVWENGEAWWETQPLNIILGTSVEDQESANERIPLLQSIPAAARVVSFEPVLEYIILEREWFSCTQ